MVRNLVMTGENGSANNMSEMSINVCYVIQ